MNDTEHAKLIKRRQNIETAAILFGVVCLGIFLVCVIVWISYLDYLKAINGCCCHG